MDEVTLERGKGWWPDPLEVVTAELADRHIDDLVGAPRSAGAIVLDYSPLLDGREIDQRATSSCVGQAFAIALYLNARISGIGIPFPSAKAIYDFARLEDDPYASLVDQGSRPIRAMRGLVEKGAVADEDWPLVFSENGRSNVNDPPPLDVYQKSLAATVGTWYRILPGQGASTMVRRALAAGYCPMFAMPVDEAFERWTGATVYPGRVGPSLGGHMQAIVGFGDGHVVVQGSWGVGWAASGVVRIANDYLDSGECTDVLVVTAVPKLERALDARGMT